MPRLSRLRLVSVGHPQARMDDLVLDFRDRQGRATDSTLWLRNGGGKSSILNLFFAIVRTDKREFLGGKSEAKRRTLDDYVLGDDRAVVVAEWELDSGIGPLLDLGLDEEPERFLTGVFYERRSGGSRGARSAADADDGRMRESGALRRLFFTTRVSADDPATTLEGIPIYVERGGRRLGRRTLSAFRQEWQMLREQLPHLEPGLTENQREWREQLASAGLDPDLFAYQLRMNLREGGADEMFRFDEAEDFVDFLLELAVDPALGERVGRNIVTFRQELKERKDQLVPERELVAGLGERLAPVVAVAAERRELGRELAAARGLLEALGDFLATRLSQLDDEDARLEREAEQGWERARQARAEAAGERCRAAGLRRYLTRVRCEQAEEELAKHQRAMEQAQRLRRLWDAAVPLREARRFETKAAGFRRELERKQAEEAPLRTELGQAARSYAAALRHHVDALRADEQRERRAAARAEDEARGAERAAAENQSAAAVAGKQIEDLEARLRRVVEVRAELLGAGVLEADETGRTATERLRAARDDHDRRLEAITAELAELDRRSAELAARIRQTTGEVAAARARLDSERARRDEAERERRRLEEDPVLLRALELETLDLDRLGDDAIGTLTTLARRQQGRVVELRMARSADDRAVVHLQEHGLLPPSPDVEQILRILVPHLPAAWSGWTYLESFLPAEGDARQGAVEAAPQLAEGVVVRGADLEKALELLRAEDFVPETPVVLATPEALERAAEPGVANPGGLVLGPASRAWYDRGAGQEELVRLQARQDEVSDEIRRHEAQVGELGELAAGLREFRRLYPRGWFREAAARREQQEAAATRLGERLRRLEGDHDETRELASRLTEEAAERRRAREKVAAQLLRGERFLEEYEEPSAGWRGELERLRQRVREEEAEGERRRQEADEARRLASEARARAQQLGEDARAGEEELRQVAYVDGAIEPAAGAVEPLRDRYQQLRSLYEEKVGAEGLLQLAREAEDNARGERRRLAAVLHQEITEPEVAELLDSLADPGEAERRRDQAQEAWQAAFGMAGRSSQALSRAQEASAAAQERCRELGEVAEPEEPPAELAEAEDLATAAETAGKRLEAEAAEEEEMARQAVDQRRGAEHEAAGLRKDQRHLETLREGSAELLAEIEPVAPDRPLDAAELDAHLGHLDQVLRQARDEARRLDAERRRAVRAIREWAADEAFENLQSRVARQFRTIEDHELERHAEPFQDQLRLRQQQIEAQLADVDRHRELLVQEAVAAAEEGLSLLQTANVCSRLPEHVPGLGGAQFLRIITHTPDDPGERRGRIGELIDELIDSDAFPKGVALVQHAVRRLARPIRVRVLNPDPSVGRRSVEITEMARFSGGEQLTGAILLYCTLAQLRARTRGLARKSASVLLLDNPIGRASRVRFLELQREFAHAMSVQLVYTTAVNDHEALRTLPNVIRLRNQRIDRNRGHRLVEHEEDGGGLLEAVRVGRDEGDPS